MEENDAGLRYLAMRDLADLPSENRELMKAKTMPTHTVRSA
jgi:hypothetical protein